jgi:hypothetical protein
MGYIDPNTGGMLFQVLAAGFALITGAALVFSAKIRAALARLRRASRRETGEDSPPQPESDNVDNDGQTKVS